MNKGLVLAGLAFVVGIGGFLFTQGIQSTKARAGQVEGASSTNTADKTYTLAQVAEHASAADCWMAIEGGVYDVTSYLPMHPGGSQQAMVGCGKDATEMFNARPTQNYTAHPPKARALLMNYKIGTLQE